MMRTLDLKKNKCGMKVGVQKEAGNTIFERYAEVVDDDDAVRRSHLGLWQQ